MPAKIDADSNLRFLYSCFKHSNYSTINYQSVASDFEIKPPAARMRLMRLKMALDSTLAAAHHAEAAAKKTGHAGAPRPSSSFKAPDGDGDGVGSGRKGRAKKGRKKGVEKGGAGRGKKGFEAREEDSDDDEDDDDGCEGGRGVDEDEYAGPGTGTGASTDTADGAGRADGKKRMHGWIRYEAEERDDEPLLKRFKAYHAQARALDLVTVKEEQPVAAVEDDIGEEIRVKGRVDECSLTPAVKREEGREAYVDSPDKCSLTPVKREEERVEHVDSAVLIKAEERESDGLQDSPMGSTQKAKESRDLPPGLARIKEDDHSEMELSLSGFAPVPNKTKSIDEKLILDYTRAMPSSHYGASYRASLDDMKSEPEPMSSSSAAQHSFGPIKLEDQIF